MQSKSSCLKLYVRERETIKNTTSRQPNQRKKAKPPFRKGKQCKLTTNH